MKLPRPKFSLLTLVLLCAATGAGIGVYLRSAPWVVEREFGLVDEDFAPGPRALTDGRHLLLRRDKKTCEYFDLSISQGKGNVVQAPWMQTKFSPDGRYLFIHRGSNQLELRESRTNQIRRTYTVHPGNYMFQVSANGQHFFETGSEPAIWDMSNDIPLFKRASSHLIKEQREVFKDRLNTEIPKVFEKAAAAENAVAFADALQGPKERTPNREYVPSRRNFVIPTSKSS